MKTTLKNNNSIFTLFSKRDALILSAAILLSSTSYADRSKTEAQGPTDCIDCVVGAETYGNSNFGDLRGMMKDVAIFSKDPNKFVDPREILDRTANPQLNAIGLLKIQGDSRVASRDTEKVFAAGENGNAGSGFLINECLVITNHHVAFQNRRANEFNAKKIEFFAGSSGNAGSPFAFKSEGRVVSHGNMQYTGDNKNDWAIIKLDQPVADPNNPNDPRHLWQIKPEFKTFREIARDPVSSASFYQDEEKYRTGLNLWGQKSCNLVRRGVDSNESLWGTDCPGIAGVSGSALMSQSQPGKPLVAYGLMKSVSSKNRTELKATDDNLNFMLPFSEAFTPEELQKIINDNPCRRKDLRV